MLLIKLAPSILYVKLRSSSMSQACHPQSSPPAPTYQPLQLAAQHCRPEACGEQLAA